MMGVILAILSSLVSALGPVYIKEKPFPHFKFFLGVFLYGLGILLFIAALNFGELSVLYPIIALTYVWVFLLSKFMLKEKLTLSRTFGVVLIILGIIVIIS